MENLVLNNQEQEVILTSKEKRQYYKNEAIERAGETRVNNTGSLMTIDEYNSYNDIWVRFIESGYIVHTAYSAFKNGSVKNPHDKSVFGHGYIGVGEYNIKDENGNITKQYTTWVNMMQRSYSKKFKEKYPTYKDCTVCEEWHNYQNFAKWYDENYYEIEGQRMCVDKDILIKGNKIYSPDTCVIVPQSINILFVKRNALRGDLPCGVDYHKRDKVFRAKCGDGKKQIILGYFKTPEEAFITYKNFKEQFIKEMADRYKTKIPSKLYDAMYSYTVDITD